MNRSNQRYNLPVAMRDEFLLNLQMDGSKVRITFGLKVSGINRPNESLMDG